MELLHERLRVWAKDAAPIYTARTQLKRDNLFDAFADEIERDYIPRPVDANGKPWEINDACIVYGNDAVVRGYGNKVALIVCDCKTGDYSEVHVDYVARPEERTPIEKLRDEMKSYAHSHVPDSVLDGWVKDLDAYIDQQGKDE